VLAIFFYIFFVEQQEQVPERPSGRRMRNSCRQSRLSRPITDPGGMASTVGRVEKSPTNPAYRHMADMRLGLASGLHTK